jgi:hypothetical protein
MKSSKKRPMNQLERDAAIYYYENMCEEELKAERDLENAIAGAPRGIDFDTEESPLTQTALWTKL